MIALLWNVVAAYCFGRLLLDGNTEVKETVQNIVILIIGYYFGSTRVQNEALRSQAEKDKMQPPASVKTKPNKP